MKKLTFGVSASSFAANMAIQQNALDHEKSHSQAAQAVLHAFYIDDGLLGEDSIKKDIRLQAQLQELFELWRICATKMEVELISRPSAHPFSLAGLGNLTGDHA